MSHATSAPSRVAARKRAESDTTSSLPAAVAAAPYAVAGGLSQPSTPNAVLCKAGLTRVSSRPVWELLVRGSSPLWHTRIA